MRLRPTAMAVLLALAVCGCDAGGNQPFQGWVEADLIFVSPDELRVGQPVSIALAAGEARP